MRGLAALSLILGLALPAGAQTQPGDMVDSWLSAIELPWGQPQKPHPSVARIIVPERDGVAFGSGTLVDVNDEHGLVVTNWHVVEGASREITVAFPDGFRSAGQVLKLDRDWDLAALRISKPRAAPVPLAPQAPRPGELLTIAGYGSGSYRAASGRCTQYVGPGPNFPFEMVELAATARQGDSGGPIFNSQGQLAGVLFGEGHGRTSGSYCGRVHLFLASISKSNPTAPATIDTAAIATTPPPIPAGPRQVTPPSRDPLPPLSTAPPPTSAVDLASLPPRRTVAFTGDRVVRPSAAAPVPEPPVANRFWPDQEPAGPPSAASDWQRYIGQTALEQLKSVLATVGAMALLLQGFRWLTSGG